MKKFQILQINEENENALKAMFMSFDRLAKYGITLTRDMYNVVYEGEREDSTKLDDIFREFNMAHPADFRGHSLSVSDIVFIDGKYYYCDSFGWEEVAFSEEEKRFSEQVAVLDNNPTAFVVYNILMDLAMTEIRTPNTMVQRLSTTEIFNKMRPDTRFKDVVNACDDLLKVRLIDFELVPRFARGATHSSLVRGFALINK